MTDITTRADPSCFLHTLRAGRCGIRYLSERKPVRSMDGSIEYVLILRKVAHQVANYANYVARRLQRQGLITAIDISETVSPPDTPPAVTVVISFRLLCAEEGAIKRLRKYAYDKSGKGRRLAKMEEEILSGSGAESEEEYERGDQDQGPQAYLGDLGEEGERAGHDAPGPDLDSSCEGREG